MAEGYAKATGKVGVCLATSGPGATNLVTGLADAYMDNVPILAITGRPCPGCGGLRAVNDLTNGDVAGALSSNLMAVALVVAGFAAAAGVSPGQRHAELAGGRRVHDVGPVPGGRM